MSAFKEGSLGLMIYGGAAAFVVGILGGSLVTLGSMMQGVRFGATGNPLDRLAMVCFAVGVFGLVAAVAGILTGATSAGRIHKGRVVAYTKVRVVARYALDSNMVMHTTEDSVAYCDRPKFYVRLDLGTGENEEYQCSEPVFWSAGEGMWGNAQVQGKWLGGFQPLQIGSAHLANDVFGDEGR